MKAPLYLAVSIDPEPDGPVSFEFLAQGLADIHGIPNETHVGVEAYLNKEDALGIRQGFNFIENWTLIYEPPTGFKVYRQRVEGFVVVDAMEGLDSPIVGYGMSEHEALWDVEDACDTLLVLPCSRILWQEVETLKTVHPVEGSDANWCLDIDNDAGAACVIAVLAGMPVPKRTEH